LSERRPAIVGVGNVLMGDDGIGPAAIEALRQGRVGDRAELIDAGLALGEVLCDLDPHQPLVIIDALRGGGGPGSLYRLGLDVLNPQGASVRRAVSLHEVGVQSALRMEALSGREFTHVTIFGVEPGKVAWGQRLSRPVAQSLKNLVRVIRGYLDELAAPEAQGDAVAGGTSRGVQE